MRSETPPRANTARVDRRLDMAFLLSAPVGRGGANHSWDVLFVQDALNRVPSADGGPQPPLTSDGLCGPKTRKAISNFQLKHFGWSGADGLVEPGKQTHRKLEEYDKSGPGKTTPPPAKPEPVATRFVVQRVGAERSFGALEQDCFFQLISVPHNYHTVYWLGPRWKKHPRPPTGKFRGYPSIFNSRVALRSSDFACDAAFLSTEYRKTARTGREERKVESQLVLAHPRSQCAVPMETHLIGPRGLVRSVASSRKPRSGGIYIPPVIPAGYTPGVSTSLSGYFHPIAI